MRSLVHALVEIVAWVVAPNGCAACDAPIPARIAFCASCARTVVEAPSEGAAHVAPFLYGGALAQAITRFKYERRVDLARPLAGLLARALGPLAERPPGVVVPVPLHRARLVERGFNQSALLARSVARALDAQFAPRALERTRDTAKQATLDRTARQANVARAFTVRAPGAVAGRRVLLVDDVRTTGATLRACAEALATAGTLEVVTLVLARAA